MTKRKKNPSSPQAKSSTEDEGIKAKGQADFRKDFRTTGNIFVLKILD